MKKIMLVLLLSLQPLVAVSTHSSGKSTPEASGRSGFIQDGHDSRGVDDERVATLCDRPQGCCDRPIKAIFLITILTGMYAVALASQEVQQEG